MDKKRWSLFVIIGYVTLMAVIGVTVVVIDPYFHYHAPLNNISYVINKEVYQNDGISKNFSYDALITGTSMTICFKTEEIDELFDVTSVRLTFMGEGFKRINENLETAIAANPDIKLVIRGVDTLWFVSDKDNMGYEDYPEYLYDDMFWNDVQYLYNIDVIRQDVLPVLLRSLKGEEPYTFDDDTIGNGSYGKDVVFKAYKRKEKSEQVIDAAETEAYFKMLDENLEENVISVIEANPDITFYLFFPPYSICYWDDLNQHGQQTLKRRIDMEQFAIEKLLPYENVRLFSFFNNYEMICNLDNYIDDVHYVEDINSQILKWMREDEYRLTQENYMDYIHGITEYYCNYNYDALFQDMK